MNTQPQLKDPPNPFPIPLGVLVAPLPKLEDEELGARFAFCAGPTTTTECLHHCSEP